MSSTTRKSEPPVTLQLSGSASIRWRVWPLIDSTWSWLLPIAILMVGSFAVWYGSWLVGIAVVVALAIVFWQFLLPVTYEVTPLGLRRYAIGRVRLVPWQAIRSFQLRATGVVFFQRPNPTRVDQLIGLFVPYPQDEDEMLVAVRLYLPHAVEVP